MTAARGSAAGRLGPRLLCAGWAPLLLLLLLLLGFISPLLADVVLGAKATGGGTTTKPPGGAGAGQKESGGGGAGRCPRFWLLGAMKCGTSTLNRHLMRHLGGADGLGQLRKEYHTFTRPRPNLNTYKKLPAGKGPNSTAAIARALHRVEFTLDASPRYLHMPAVPRRLAQACSFHPHEPPRFIINLCDPGRRAWSHFRQSVGFGHKTRPKQGLAVGFDRLVSKRLPGLRRCLSSRAASGSGSCVQRGAWEDEVGYNLYDEQPQRLFKSFPRESFLVVERDSWAVNVKQMVAAVAGHFGLQATWLDSVEERMQLDHKSIGKGDRPSEKTRRALEEVFRAKEQWKKEVLIFGQSHS